MIQWWMLETVSECEEQKHCWKPPQFPHWYQWYPDEFGGCWQLECVAKIHRLYTFVSNWNVETGLGWSRKEELYCFAGWRGIQPSNALKTVCSNLEGVVRSFIAVDQRGRRDQLMDILWLVGGEVIGSIINLLGLTGLVCEYLWTAYS